MPMRSKYADSSRISVVASDTSEVDPPMIPAMACGRALGVADQQVLGGEHALDAVEGRDRLPVVGEPHDDAARRASRARSNACSGWLRSSST